MQAFHPEITLFEELIAYCCEVSFLLMWNYTKLFDEEPLIADWILLYNAMMYIKDSYALTYYLTHFGTSPIDPWLGGVFSTILGLGKFEFEYDYSWHKSEGLNPNMVKTYLGCVSFKSFIFHKSYLEKPLDSLRILEGELYLDIDYLKNTYIFLKNVFKTYVPYSLIHTLSKNNFNFDELSKIQTGYNSFLYNITLERSLLNSFFKKSEWLSLHHWFIMDKIFDLDPTLMNFDIGKEQFSRSYKRYEKFFNTWRYYFLTYDELCYLDYNNISLKTLAKFTLKDFSYSNFIKENFADFKFLKFLENKSDFFNQFCFLLSKFLVKECDYDVINLNFIKNLNFSDLLFKLDDYLNIEINLDFYFKDILSKSVIQELKQGKEDVIFDWKEIILPFLQELNLKYFGESDRKFLLKSDFSFFINFSDNLKYFGREFNEKCFPYKIYFKYFHDLSLDNILKRGYFTLNNVISKDIILKEVDNFNQLDLLVESFLNFDLKYQSSYKEIFKQIDDSYNSFFKKDIKNKWFLFDFFSLNSFEIQKIFHENLFIFHPKIFLNYSGDSYYKSFFLTFQNAKAYYEIYDLEKEYEKQVYPLIKKKFIGFEDTIVKPIEAQLSVEKMKDYQLFLRKRALDKRKTSTTDERILHEIIKLIRKPKIPIKEFENAEKAFSKLKLKSSLYKVSERIPQNLIFKEVPKGFEHLDYKELLLKDFKNIVTISKRSTIDLSKRFFLIESFKDETYDFKDSMFVDPKFKFFEKKIPSLYCSGISLFKLDTFYQQLYLELLKKLSINNGIKYGEIKSFLSPLDFKTYSEFVNVFKEVYLSKSFLTKVDYISILENKDSLNQIVKGSNCWNHSIMISKKKEPNFFFGLDKLDIDIFFDSYWYVKLKDSNSINMTWILPTHYIQKINQNNIEYFFKTVHNWTSNGIIFFYELYPYFWENSNLFHLVDRNLGLLDGSKFYIEPFLSTISEVSQNAFEKLDKEFQSYYYFNGIEKSLPIFSIYEQSETARLWVDDPSTIGL